MLITPQLLAHWTSIHYSNVERALVEFKSTFAVHYKLSEDGRSVLLRFNPVTRHTRSVAISRECANLHLSLVDYHVISRSIGKLPVYHHRYPTVKSDVTFPDIKNDNNSDSDIVTSLTASHKLDGISFILYWYKNTWHVRAENSLVIEFDLETLIGNDAGYSLTGLDQSNSYVLELISDDIQANNNNSSRSCRTCYPENGLYYITTLNNETGKQPAVDYESGFDYIQRHLPTVKPIPHFVVNNEQQLTDLLDSLPFNIQGLVLEFVADNDTDTATDDKDTTAADATSVYVTRILVPNPRYSILHSKLRKNWLTYEDVIVLLDILDFPQFVALFPNAIAQFDEIDKRKRHLFNVIQTVYEQINNDAGESQKEFATYASRYSFSQFLFNLRNKGLTADYTWSRTPIHSRYDLLFNCKHKDVHSENTTCNCTSPNCKS